MNYAQAICQDCGEDKQEFCCDDVCIECEAEFLRNNPDEIPFLLEQIERAPTRFAPWKAALDVLCDDLDLLTLIGQCRAGDKIVNKNTIESLLRLAYSLGKFKGTSATIATFTKGAAQ